MKRFILIPVIMIMLLLGSCSVKEYTPEIPDKLDTCASVASGDFCFNCRIYRTVDKVSVTVLDTSAKDMIMSYDGSELTFSYADYTYSVDGEGYEQSNAAIVIYNLFEAIATDDVTAKKTDGGYKYKGVIDLGEFTLIQNDDNTLRLLTIPSADYKVEFY